ncbi:MAG: aspartate kinase [Nitrososphaerales archaeon]
MVESIVIKFGGSVLQDEETIGKAADMVREVYEKGLRPVVVVSALKGATDNLLNLAKKLNPDTPDDILDQILSMGERTSARVFSAALVSRGLKPVIVDPEFEDWPIITDDKHLDANPIYKETEKEAQRKILPMLESGKVPVVCGFLGKTQSGKVTTLGRGGSDTTGLLLGSCLKSREIVLVKDVETIFSSDPDVVENPVPLQLLDSEEAFLLSTGGAKFLHSKALSYNRSGVRIRIAGIQDGGRLGTIIDGGALDLVVEQSPDPVTMVTIIGEKALGADQIRQLMIGVRDADGSIFSLTLDPKSTVLYVVHGTNLADRLHRLVMENNLGKALSFFEDLRMVIVKGPALETVPGLIQRVTQPLARKNINVFGLVTISSSIRIFVSKDNADAAVTLLRSALLALK